MVVFGINVGAFGKELVDAAELSACHRQVEGGLARLRRGSGEAMAGGVVATGGVR
jgi:hypothetical protein